MLALTAKHEQARGVYAAKIQINKEKNNTLKEKTKNFCISFVISLELPTFAWTNIIVMKRLLTILALMSVLTVACTTQGRGEQEAQELLKEAQTAFDGGQYDKTISTIERLRHDYPKAIEQRRAALELYKEASLKKAQAELAQTDSLLEAAKAHYSRLQQELLSGQWVKGQGVKNKEHEMTEARRLVDSLQVQFVTQCAKIKYIHRRQK